MRLWTTSSLVWICLTIGILGTVGAICELFIIEERYMPLWMSPLMLLGALGLLRFAFIYRREEWVTFLLNTNARGRYYRIQFCRNGPDAGSFADFTNNLVERINRHARVGSSQP